jgi:hypothetical protein
MGKPLSETLGDSVPPRIIAPQLLFSILCYSGTLVLLPEELLQIRHTTNDGAGYGSGTGEENSQTHDDRSCVTPWLCASRQGYGRKTNKEPGPGASERTKQRATHETPQTCRGAE